MEAAGFLPEDYETDPAEVWPENWPIFQLFFDLNTQWRVGATGATGLDYNVLFRLLDEAGLHGAEWREAFDTIRVMEATALEMMRKE